MFGVQLLGRNKIFCLQLMAPGGDTELCYRKPFCREQYSNHG